MSHKIHQRGFTLLELLVVIAVMGVVSTIMTAVWFQVMDANRISQVRTNLESNVQNVFSDMRKDFEGVVSPLMASAPLVGEQNLNKEDEERSGPRVTLLELASDSISFDARLMGLDGLMHTERVTYFIERPGPEGQESTGDSALMRKITLYGQEALPEGEEPVSQRGEVLSGVTAMRIEYLSNGEWLPSWSEEEMNPEAVRVSLLAMVPRAEGTSREAGIDELNEAVTRVAVFPIHTQ